MRQALRAVVDGPPWRGAALFAALFLAVALPRIAEPPVYVFDEVYQAFTAGRYATGDRDAYVWWTKAAGSSRFCAYEWVHPPVAKLILAGSVLAFGDRPVAWRLPCAFAGAALVAATYVLARRMLRTRGAAELAALALATDGLVIVMSRTGMSDVFVALFVLLSYGSFWRWLRLRWPAGGEPPDRPRMRRQLYFTGVLLGLAVATKWFGLIAWAWIGLVVGGEAVHATARPKRGREGHAFASLGHVLAAMVVVPAGIYVASYIPFFAHGYSLGHFAELLRQEAHYHAHLRAAHDYASPWWSWPLSLRSVWLWTGTQGVHRDIYLVGNPVFWWVAVLALGRLGYGVLTALWRRQRPDLATVLMLLAFFGQWLPWALPARTAFLYYILSAAPFAAMAVAAFLAERAARGRPLAALCWAGALLAVALWLYPIWTGLPLGEASHRARLLLPGWK